MSYSNFTRNRTPQTVGLDGQTKNNAGGYSFTVDKWTRLERFLILGSEGGTYYVGSKELTRQSAKVVDECLSDDYRRALDLIKTISVEGRAAKTQPALFALALACTHKDDAVRSSAYAQINAICRTGTHLFTLIGYVTNLKGGRSGSGFQRAIARWYTDKPVEKVAYQTIKYRSREGWSHRDALRISHPKVDTKDRKHLFNFICDRPNSDKIAKYDSLKKVEGFLAIQQAKNAQAAAKIISEYELPWETVPTQFHNEKVVWEAIYDAGQLGLTAAIRQLPRLTRLGVINSRPIATMITDPEALKRARVHPLFILNALETYRLGGQQHRYAYVWGAGRAAKPGTPFNPARKILDALDKAFYASFGNVTPTGKRIHIGIDVSGSMSSLIANTNISCAMAAGAMALVTANVESEYDIHGFAGNYVNLPISPRQRLDDVMRHVQMHNFGSTDCALPMNWSLRNRREFDAFIVITDSETWAGQDGHPSEALVNYRQKMGIDAKLIVVGMTATEFTIADPNDAGSLDVVGFDTNTPNLISNFIADGF